MPDVDLEDLLPAVHIGQSDIDDPVESSGPQQRIIEDIGPVGGSDDLDVAGGGDSVELGEELHEGPLDLAVARGGDVEASRSDGVELVDEYDAGRLVLGELEQLADEPGAFSDVLLDELRSDHPDERRLSSVGDGLGHQRLTGSGGSDEKDSLGGLDSDLLVELGPQQRILHGLPELQHLVLQTSDVVVGDVRLVDDLRAGDDRVDGGREDLHERQGLLVERHPGSRDQVLLIHVFGDGDDEIGSGGALDHDAVVREHVSERCDYERRALEPLELVPEPGEVLLQSEEFALGVAFLRLGVLEVLHQPDIALLEGDNLGLELGHVIVLARHMYSVGVRRTIIITIIPRARISEDSGTKNNTVLADGPGMICEMCGKDVPQTREAIVSGARIMVCPSCSKFGEMSGTAGSSRPGAPVSQSVIDQRLERRERRMQSKDIYAGTTTIEIVDDYGGVIRRAREARGMDLKTFANEIQEKQGILAKVESNNLVPEDRLIKKIEKALDIKLTEAVQSGGTVGGSYSNSMTLGNFIKRE